MAAATRDGPPGRVIVPALFAAALLLPHATNNAFYLSTAVVALEFVALAVMFDLVVGRVGALSLAQPLFFGFGAYSAALLGQHGLSSFAAQAVLVMASSALLGFLVGVPSFRLSLHSFAIGTLAFGQIALLVATNWISVTNGPLCITGVPPAVLPGLSGEFVIDSLSLQFYLALGIAVVAVVAILVIEALSMRLPIIGVREEPVLAAARGFSVTGTRLAVFATSAAFTGLVGSFDAQFQSVVCPGNLSFSYMVPLLIMVFVGGRASLRGVVLAALLFTITPQALRMADEWRLVLYGAVLLLVISIAPDGLERLLDRGGQVGAWLMRRGSPSVDDDCGRAVDRKRARAVASPPLRGRDQAQPRSPGAALEVRHLSKSFQGVRAVDDLNVSIGPGELVGLIGPNGSGKSTALDCICGQQRPDSGEVLLDADRLTMSRSHTLAPRGVVRTFQDARVFDALTVADNLLLAAMGRTSRLRRWPTLLRPVGVASRAIQDELDELLGSMGLHAVAHHRAGRLSYGQRKLTDFAAACIQRPRLLLLDEPVAAVSPVIVEVITDRLRRMHQNGVTILVVEHNLELIQNLCERVIVLDGGRKIADGDPRSVMANEEVHAAYFGS